MCRCRCRPGRRARRGWNPLRRARALWRLGARLARVERSCGSFQSLRRECWTHTNAASMTTRGRSSTRAEPSSCSHLSNCTCHARHASVRAAKRDSRPGRTQAGSNKGGSVNHKRGVFTTPICAHACVDSHPCLLGMKWQDPESSMARSTDGMSRAEGAEGASR